jgi:hypothetical protein
MRYRGFSLALLLSLCPAPAGAELVWHWRDDFGPGEQAHLRAWVTEVQTAQERLVSPLPFDVHIHFHRRDGAPEPVPWAHTDRHPWQAVHFHVDPSHSRASLRTDWTAAHELSHLLLPYLGRDNAWFAEGFASYMQYQVMQAMGVLEESTPATLYADRISRAEARYQHHDRPFTEAAAALAKARQFPVLHWGGAVFFLRVDTRLRATEDAQVDGLTDLLAAYLRCCRRQRQSLPGLVAELDRLSGTRAFSETLREFRTVKGFPRYRDLL